MFVWQAAIKYIWNMLNVICILMRHKYLSAFSELCVRSIKFSAFTDWSCCLVDLPALRLRSFRAREKSLVVTNLYIMFPVYLYFTTKHQNVFVVSLFSFRILFICRTHDSVLDVGLCCGGISRFSLLSLTWLNDWNIRKIIKRDLWCISVEFLGCCENLSSGD